MLLTGPVFGFLDGFGAAPTTNNTLDRFADCGLVAPDDIRVVRDALTVSNAIKDATVVVIV